MVSLRKYLTSSEETQACRRAVDVLVHGIVESAVCIDLAEYKVFSEEVNRIAATAPPGCDGDELLVMSASAVQELQGYNVRTTGLAKRQVRSSKT